MWQNKFSIKQLKVIVLCIFLVCALTYVSLNTSLGAINNLPRVQNGITVDSESITATPDTVNGVKNNSEHCGFLRRRPISRGEYYLLPLWIVPSGPSTVYNLWRIAVKFAIFQQRSIVVRHFFQHKSSKRKEISSTFDLEILEGILSVKTVDNFTAQCGRSLSGDDVFVPPPAGAKSKEPLFQLYDQLVTWKATYLMSCSKNVMNKIDTITANGNVVPKSIGQSMRNDYYKSKQKHCISLLPTDDVILPCNEEINEIVDKYLVRAAYIRKMAERFTPTVCNGMFALMHWRNKSGERCPNNEHCKEGRKPEVESLEKAADGIAASIKQLLQRNNLSCIYVAAPVLYNQTITARLESLSLQVFGLSDLFTNVPESMKYTDDNYVLSLVEQEIAERVPLFISSRTSNWSFYVEYTRTIRRMRTVAVQELPGVPQDLINMFQVLK